MRTRSAKTDSAGRWTIADVDPDVTWTMRLHDPAGVYRLQWWPNRSTIPTSVPIPLDATEGALDVALTPKAAVPSVAGVVTSRTDGTPVAGIEVRAFVDRFTVARTTTGPDGTYVLPNLIPGSYTVRFSHPAGAWRTRWWDDQLKATATPLVLEPGAVFVADATLRPA